MAWLRETRIRIFTQVDLKAYLDEVDWRIRFYNCAAFNCLQEENQPRPLPSPPDYNHNLQSRLVKVKKGILPPTLKMIINAYYHLPAHQAPVISPAVQPDDMMGRHRDGEHNPLERPQASEEEEVMVADGTSSTDQGRDIFFQTEVGKDPQNITSHRSPFHAAD